MISAANSCHFLVSAHHTILSGSRGFCCELLARDLELFSELAAEELREELLHPLTLQLARNAFSAAASSLPSSLRGNRCP